MLMECRRPVQKGRPLAGRTHSGMPAKMHASDIAAIRCHVQTNKLLMLAALWERPCRFGLICAHQASTPAYLKQAYQTKQAERKTPPLGTGTDSASPRTPSCRCPWPGGVFGQQLRARTCAWPPQLNPIKRLEVMPIFWLSVCWLFLRKITKNNEQQTTVPLSLLTTHLCARACLSGKSAGGR